MAEKPQTAEGASGAALASALAAGSGRADSYLDEQTRLARLQIEQIEEDNALRRRLLRLEHASALMKVAFELVVAAIVVAIVIGVGAAMWSAVGDKGLIVEPFSVPPDLANRGLNGQVVAAKLLDTLARLQTQTVSNRAASSYANNWGDDIKVQIPDTGVSIGEFNRYLRAWLGHQTHISGEIYRTAAGIAVSARVGSDPGRSFTGTDGEFDALMQKAAEAVYHATQPYRYAVYLANAGRDKEAEAAYQALIADGSPQDRAWAYMGIEGLYQGRNDTADARKVLRQALSLRPDFVIAYTNIAGLEGQLQHDEAALAAQTRLVALLRRRHDPDVSAQGAAIALPSAESGLAARLGDFAAQLVHDREVEALPEFEGQVENARQGDLAAYAGLHDLAGARAVFAEFPPTDNPQVKLVREAGRVLAELLMGRPLPLLQARATFENALTKLGPTGPAIIRRQLWPYVAQALALSGDAGAAHALIDRTPADCGVCLRMHGRIDALEKNWAGAGYWFARAASDAPSPPFAYADWGAMLLDKGDADGAIAKFEAAHEKGPHFADALEMWGEALVAKNRSDLALAKFEEADKYAPNWGRLHLKWGEALWWSGDKDGAKRQYSVAARLDLSASDRSEFARVSHG